MTKPKSNTTLNNATQKHSILFHISPTSLFNNKRLKRKRLKWLDTLEQAKKFNNRRTRRKQNLSKLKPDVTINLLSDNEVEEAEISRNEQNNITQKPQNAPASVPVPPLQHFIVYPSQLELAQLQQLQFSNGANIRLTPLPNLKIDSLQSQNSVKRKRKCRQPKRHSAPTLINDECIVLSDDDEKSRKQQTLPLAATLTTSASAPPPLAPLSLHLPSQPMQLPQAQSTPTLTPTTKSFPITPPRFAQVDEEVTVSLVPRSSTTGSCAKATNSQKQVFPMLPDETTVHTVIANRIYELSLTKLREGLATCGVQEFATEGQQIKPGAHGKTNPPEALVSSKPAAPISLKLSSDLSISLISDEEGDETGTTKAVRPQRPSVKVQPVERSAALATDTLQVPRRRKLG